ncbi:hypothetical protein [Aeromonas hydrophila]|uniref:hypothetical protein n=1 Tax=Aeromonas hydrophila TaxID=644 RepID=UPI003F79EE1E
MQQAKTQYLGTLSGIPQLETSLRQPRPAADGHQHRQDPQGELALVTEMPANLLRRRPDVRVAERQLAAQSESELYPSITLLGTLGVNANKSSKRGCRTPASRTARALS